MRFFILMPLIPGLIIWAICIFFGAAAKKGQQIELQKTCAAKSRTPNRFPIVDQLDNFWRENFVFVENGDRETFTMKYLDFVKKLESQLAKLPQTEQGTFLAPLLLRNAEYIDISNQDRTALKARLGMMGKDINQQFGNAATSPLAAVSRSATSSQGQSAPSEDKHAVVYPLPVKDIL